MKEALNLRGILMHAGYISKFHSVVVFYPGKPEKGKFRVEWDEDYEGAGPCFSFHKGDGYEPVWSVTEDVPEWKGLVDLDETGWVISQYGFQRALEEYRERGSSFEVLKDYMSHTMSIPNVLNSSSLAWAATKVPSLEKEPTFIS